MAKRQRDPAREHLWRNRLAAWQASGLTIRAFCRRHHLAETSFHYWRRELQARDATTSPTNRPMFVPVRVLTEIDTVATPPQPEARHATMVEVRCPSGHVVTLPLAEVTLLRHLFAALTHLPGSSGEDLPC